MKYQGLKINTKIIIEKKPYDFYYVSSLEKHPYIMVDGKTKAHSIYDMKKLIKSLSKMDKSILFTI